MAERSLSLRAINRATLARQLLLERATLPVEAAVEHLVGLQAQTTHSWYVGLWTRLEGFDAPAAGAVPGGHHEEDGPAAAARARAHPGSGSADRKPRVAGS